jgi:hypothetical protein
MSFGRPSFLGHFGSIMVSLEVLLGPEGLLGHNNWG